MNISTLYVLSIGIYGIDAICEHCTEPPKIMSACVRTLCLNPYPANVENRVNS